MAVSDRHFLDSRRDDRAERGSDRTVWPGDHPQRHPPPAHRLSSSSRPRSHSHSHSHSAATTHPSSPNREPERRHHSHKRNDSGSRGRSISRDPRDPHRHQHRRERSYDSTPDSRRWKTYSSYSPIPFESPSPDTLRTLQAAANASVQPKVTQPMTEAAAIKESYNRKHRLENHSQSRSNAVMNGTSATRSSEQGGSHQDYRSGERSRYVEHIGSERDPVMRLTSEDLENGPHPLGPAARGHSALRRSTLHEPGEGAGKFRRDDGGPSNSTSLPDPVPFPIPTPGHSHSRHSSAPHWRASASEGHHQGAPHFIPNAAPSTSISSFYGGVNLDMARSGSVSQDFINNHPGSTGYYQYKGWAAPVPPSAPLALSGRATRHSLPSDQDPSRAFPPVGTIPLGTGTGTGPGPAPYAIRTHHQVASGKYQESLELDLAEARRKDQEDREKLRTSSATHGGTRLRRAGDDRMRHSTYAKPGPIYAEVLEEYLEERREKDRDWSASNLGHKDGSHSRSLPRGDREQAHDRGRTSSMQRHASRGPQANNQSEDHAASRHHRGVERRPSAYSNANELEGQRRSRHHHPTSSSKIHEHLDDSDSETRDGRHHSRSRSRYSTHSKRSEDRSRSAEPRRHHQSTPSHCHIDHPHRHLLSESPSRSRHHRHSQDTSRSMTVPPPALVSSTPSARARHSKRVENLDLHPTFDPRQQQAEGEVGRGRHDRESGAAMKFPVEMHPNAGPGKASTH